MITSGVNKLILEPYTGKITPTAEVKSGFATVKQRSNIVGLKLLVRAVVVLGNTPTEIPAGAIVFFNETDLATGAWAKTKMKCEAIFKEEFVIANYAQVVAISVQDNN